LGVASGRAGPRLGENDFMRKLRWFLSATLFLAVTASGRAQLATVPTLLGTPPATTLAPGGTVTVDLRTWLGVPGITGQVVQFDTVRGTFNAELLANDAPLTVANFLNYVNRGAYTTSIFHRSVRNFVIQGGGFTVSGNTVNPIPADAPVRLENKVSNIRGTLAMARTSDPNSATSQWFVNTANNSSQLDTNGGGYAVFARVLGNGMAVADAIAALTIADASAQLGGTFNELPLLGLPVAAANLVVVRSIKTVPVYPTNAGDAAVVTYSLVNPPVSVVRASIAGSTLTLTGLGAGTVNVTVRVADANNSAAQAVFPVTVTETAPAITAQPTDAVIAAGQTLALNVAATGAAVTYQWKRIPGGAIAGATEPQLIVKAATAADAGIYYCTVSNGAGSLDSAGAIVAVRATGTARLTNLAVRAALDAGQTLIVGFSTTGDRSVLVRGVGPKLAEFGVANFYSDPRLEIYNGAGVLGLTNDDWNGALAATMASYGAFALTPGSKDAALVTTANGATTAQLKGAGSGVVLVEVYDAPGATGARLNNVSTLNRVGTGGDILIAGFTVGGDVAKTLLIRGVGPKLTAFNVGGVLADPKLQIFRNATKLAENDDWSASVAAATPGLGFALDAGSKDAALLITLPPGGYTAQLSGADGGTGNGLIEIYELP